ncbi:MAG: hypothetical protein INR81_01290 [Microcystis aeruginosa PMC 728.11]|uniref:hypothetical protein n=1 Tax=Microcystis aeruginosa TaxID=1126 RepID=UPI00187F4C37|nr:hypothetical protein [Microcystis aeruginosa]MBE5227835.1 hypothetical protein [Microcystis aeruginosa PMC 728.11]MBE9245912.1 hypothetical protein [Microcystis aeruginosa LEGE 00239]
MYCLTFKIIPTAAMTFRILPGSILNIATYPFVPPTTFSGFLRRIVMLSEGLDIPETSINKENPPYFTLPRQYIALGAYPVLDKWSGVHRTHRKGTRSFNHDVFSRLYIDGDQKNFQLHTWEYFIAEELIGYVVSESKSSLEAFSNLQGVGCKIGKEGFAVIDEVSESIRLQRKILSAHPSTVVPMEALIQRNPSINRCDIYNLYRHEWSADQTQDEDKGLFDTERSPINGFIPFVAAYYPEKANPLPTLDFYTDGNLQIPVALVELLQGESINV